MDNIDRCVLILGIASELSILKYTWCNRYK